MGTEMMARIKNLSLLTLIKEVYRIKRNKSVGGKGKTAGWCLGDLGGKNLLYKLC